MLARRTPGDGRAIVLIVDADPDSRAMYAEHLRYHGLRTIAVSTAQHALLLARDVDAIVTELLLPGRVDGIGLIERLKADKDTRDTPLIVVTVCAWTAERARAEHAGCDLFLSKPCLPDQLTREVQRLLAASIRSNASGGPTRMTHLGCTSHSRATDGLPSDGHTHCAAVPIDRGDVEERS